MIRDLIIFWAGGAFTVSSMFAQAKVRGLIRDRWPAVIIVAVLWPYYVVRGF